MRVWFNRTFSSVHTAIKLIREDDTTGRFHLIHSNANPHSPAAGVAHAFFVEPTGMDDSAYIDWCLAFCRERRVDIFIPGKGATLLAGEHERFAAHGIRIQSVASSAALATIHDKARFYAETGVTTTPVPEFASFETLAQLMKPIQYCARAMPRCA
jgi:phosphoribosylamine-glycine ligase